MTEKAATPVLSGKPIIDWRPILIASLVKEGVDEATAAVFVDDKLTPLIDRHVANLRSRRDSTDSSVSP